MRSSWRAATEPAILHLSGFPTRTTKRCVFGAGRRRRRQDQQRARQRLSKFPLRHGQRPPGDVKKSWTLIYLTWIKEQVHFDLELDGQPQLCCPAKAFESSGPCEDLRLIGKGEEGDLVGDSELWNWSGWMFGTSGQFALVCGLCLIRPAESLRL